MKFENTEVFNFEGAIRGVGTLHTTEKISLVNPMKKLKQYRKK